MDACREQNVVGENIGYLSTFVVNVADVMVTHDYPKNAGEKKNVGSPMNSDGNEPFCRPLTVAESEDYHLKTVV